MSTAPTMLSGLEYLAAITDLLQRIRSGHPTWGLYEAADFQWAWREPRPTDDTGQLFWFGADHEPLGALILTHREHAVSFDPIIGPDTDAALIREMVGAGLAHALDLGHRDLELEVGADQTALREAIEASGFEPSDEEGFIEASMTADNTPAVSDLADCYALSTRAETSDRPHHNIRSGPQLEERLQQTSLYRPDLDLVVHDPTEDVAGYGLFWLDPESRTGLVEPMRTHDDHQGKGLARHILTAGIDRLAAAGAERIKIVWEPDNPASSHLYLDVGFEPFRQTVIYTRNG